MAKSIHGKITAVPVGFKMNEFPTERSSKIRLSKPYNFLAPKPDFQHYHFFPIISRTSAMTITVPPIPISMLTIQFPLSLSKLAIPEPIAPPIIPRRAFIQNPCLLFIMRPASHPTNAPTRIVTMIDQIVDISRSFSKILPVKC